MLFDITSVFLNTANSSSPKLASNFANIPKIVILVKMDVNERESYGTYIRVRW